MKAKKIIMPLPSHDFDPTEVSVSWQILHAAGHVVEFTTADGNRGYADPIMISGEGLDPWGWIPGLKKIRFFGLLLRADRFGRAAYRKIPTDPNFLRPRRYADLSPGDYDGMILPGGHAPRMRQYLEDETLKNFIADFFDDVDASGTHRPVATICHGVLLAARSVSKKTGRSVLFGKRTTALTWDLERSAWMLARYAARCWDPAYYRTYMESGEDPPGHWSVESEVKRALETPDDFLQVPRGTADYRRKTNGMARDRSDDSRPAWVVRDGNYISGRWPGDVHTFAKEFAALLTES